jgi:hypothetical protein
MYHPLTPTAFAIALTLSTACGSTTYTVDTTAEPTHLAVRPITDVEIARLGVTNAWEAIERLRPNWLRQRATSARADRLPMLYVNGMRQGTADWLRWVHVHRIRRIQFFKPRDATTLWGTDHPNGAIQIIEYP